MATEKLDRDKILVVDDEKAIRDLFIHLLSFYLPHVRADVVANGAEAVEAFRHLHYAVILMDIRMPVMDGQRAFEEIMKYCKNEDVEIPSIVFCTGYQPPSALMKEITAHPSHCVLRKPVRNEDLIQTIQSRLQEGK